MDYNARESRYRDVAVPRGLAICIRILIDLLFFIFNYVGYRFEESIVRISAKV